VLHENWRRLPDKLDTADRIDVEVKWSEKAGAKRVVTDAPAEVTIGAETFDLPYHPCLSELLYGEPLYKQRRLMWNLPLPGALPDGGARDVGAAPPASASPAPSPADAGRRD
jgi:hypothetical protein